MNFQELISIKNLKFSYSQNEDANVLNDINLSIKKGEFIVILGPSGAGKSTLIKCLNGLIPHNVAGSFEGTVYIYGKNLVNEKVCNIANLIGIVFQNYETQLFNSEVQEDILFGPENYNVPREKLETILDETLSILNMTDYRHTKIEHLSGGQKQKIAIGSIIALNPKILVMDEPTTDLDPVSKESIYELSDIIQYMDKIDALIIAENETENALKADKVLIMDHGMIRKFDSAKEVLTDVDLFHTLGLQALQIPKLFFLLGITKNDLPLTPAEGADLFRKLGMKIKKEKYEILQSKEQIFKYQNRKNILHLENVSYRYPSSKKNVIDQLNLTLYQQDFISIIGQNGCGKTTLSKLINFILTPTDGRIIFECNDTIVTDLKTIRSKIAYVFQNPDQQIFSETVYDEIAFGLRTRNTDEQLIKEKLTAVLKVVNLTGKEMEDPFSLTKGDRQKIAVASALIMEPDIILLDEPTTGLDYKDQKELLELLKALNNQGHTIIMITHSMWIAAEFSNRVIVMNDGRIIFDDTPRTIFGHNEKVLNDLFLKLPHIVKMSSLLGNTMLSVDEFLSCM